jgi:hypothetical protein
MLIINQHDINGIKRVFGLNVKKSHVTIVFYCFIWLIYFPQKR